MPIYPLILSVCTVWIVLAGILITCCVLTNNKKSPEPLNNKTIEPNANEPQPSLKSDE